MANWPPPTGKPQDHQTKIKNDFPIGFFTFLLLLPREIVLERERTMANEEHFFLPTRRSEYPWGVLGANNEIGLRLKWARWADFRL